MRFFWIAICCLAVVVTPASAQTSRGAITGTVVDPSGAAVPSAVIEATNNLTGAVYKAASSLTGNYTLAELPAGVYRVTVSAQGFKNFVQEGITVQVAQILRIDIRLDVGQITETVSVTADAPLLRTETGELSHNVSSQRLKDLPVVGFNQWVRDPLASARLIPGTSQTQMAVFRVNGSPNFTQSMRVEGMETNNAISVGITKDSQPSVDAMEEVTIMTSNYAAEYGQAGGGIVNMTMKSGTNELHGSGFLYWGNEAFNASPPYGNLKQKSRVYIPGGNVGGPVYIPKLYDGRGKMFFFANFEGSRRTQVVNTLWTMPTDRMRSGDFTEAYTGKTLGKDDWGRTLVEGQLYDPATTRTVNGIPGYRDPFPNNQIPPERFDLVARAIQDKYVPRATDQSRFNNNYLHPWLYPGNQNIPSAKLDWYISPHSKISIYGGSFEGVARGMDDGIDSPFSTFRPTNTNSKTFRLSFDQTLSPTLLLHLQVGYHGNYWPDTIPWDNFDQEKELGLKGARSKRFPNLRNTSGTRGGLGTRLGGSAGPSTQSESHMNRPAASANLTWVKDNHTYKFGGEMRLERFPVTMLDNSYGVYSFSPDQTGLPSTYGRADQLKGGTLGFAYASFLLGLVNNGNIGVPSSLRLGKQSWAFYAQDSWKVTRRLTLDYGLRWDYQTYLSDPFGRMANFSPAIPNPAAGGLLGGMIYEKDGVKFAENYAYAFGPRMGFAYQITPKTVIRAGAGIIYGQTANENRVSLGTGSSNPFASPSPGEPAMRLQDGPPDPRPWPNYDPSLYVYPGRAVISPPIAIDGNAGRPPRQIQWSLSIQREIFKNLAVEVAYVGNRGAWWVDGNLINVNALTKEYLLAKGIDITKEADRNLLTTPLSKITDPRFAGWVPYGGFLTTQTLAQALRPFPQFDTINYRWAPLGRTWYDSLQAKATKRFSYGFDFTAAFTWQKELMMGSENETGGTGGGVVNDVFNRKANKYLSSFSRPFVFSAAGNYRFPVLGIYKPLSLLIRDWTVGVMLEYASGTPILAPVAQNKLSAHLFRGTYANRVPGQPLFTKDLNCTSCFDPNKDFVLNPAAWSDPLPGEFGTGAAYYNDYRYRRTPNESMSLERIFRFGERMSLSLRADFTNVLNRIRVPNPTSTNAMATQTRDKNGKPTAGFGYINTANASGARSGQMVIRLRF